MQILTGHVLFVGTILYILKHFNGAKNTMLQLNLIYIEFSCTAKFTPWKVFNIMLGFEYSTGVCKVWHWCAMLAYQLPLWCPNWIAYVYSANGTDNVGYSTLFCRVPSLLSFFWEVPGVDKESSQVGYAYVWVCDTLKCEVCYMVIQQSTNFF